MLFSLDQKPSARALVILIAAGGALFLSGLLVSGLLLAQGRADPAAYAAAWQSLDPDRLADWYTAAGFGLPAALAGYACLLGYAGFSFGAAVYLVRQVTAGRGLKLVSCAFALAGPAAALADLYATTVVLIGRLSGFRMPAALLLSAGIALNLKGIVWIVFLWLLFLSVYALIDRWLRKRRALRKRLSK